MPLIFPLLLIEQLKEQSVKKLARNDVLFRSGEAVNKVYIIHSGEVHLARPLSHGNMLTINKVSQGMLLAESSLFSSHYHCDAVANTDTSLIILDRKTVLDKLSTSPELSQSYSNYLTGEIQALRMKLELANIQSADERLLTWIRLNIDPNTQMLTIIQPLKYIASELGIAHETLYRSLKRLEQQKTIERKAGVIILKA